MKIEKERHGKRYGKANSQRGNQAEMGRKTEKIGTRENGQKQTQVDRDRNSRDKHRVTEG